MTNYEWIKKHSFIELINETLIETLLLGTLPIQLSNKIEYILYLIQPKEEKENVQLSENQRSNI